MAEILQEENQKLRGQIASVEERLQYEVETNKALVEQASIIDRLLPQGVKTNRYDEAYETFEQYNSGYGHVVTPPESLDRQGSVGNTDTILTILYEVRATFKENTSVSSQLSKYKHLSQYKAPGSDILHREGDVSSLEHFQTAARELQSRSADFAKFLSSYVNMLTQKNLTELQPQTKQVFEPYFAEPSDIRQLTSKLANMYESGLAIKREDLSTMSSDLHGAVLDVISALIAVLQAQEGGGRSSRSF